MGLFSIFKKSDIVYFPGCVTYFKFNSGFELYRKIFSRLGIEFRILDQQRCSGLEPWEAGYEVEARRFAKENFDIFNEEGIKEIITNSPGCYKMFLQNYPEYVPYWNIRVRNVWKMILDKLEKKPNLIKNMPISDIITYHDSCYLGRYCGVYDEPRKILEICGYVVKEFDNSKEESFCCGSCGGLSRVSPLLANKIAKERIFQAKRLGVDKIVVIGFENYNLLKGNIIKGMQVFEISEILGNAIGISKIEKDINGDERVLIETKANIKLREELKEEEYLDNSMEYI